MSGKIQNIVNSEDIELLCQKDPIILEVQKKYGNPPDWKDPPGFVSLSRIILGQQVSQASAEAHFNKLSEYIGEFNPNNILKLTDEEMRNCWISRQKSKYLRNLSEAILEGRFNLEKLHDLNEEEIRKELTAIKGIGNWTAEVYLLFCLQAKDIFPIGDIAVVNTIKELYGVTEKPEILLIAEKWAPLRSLGTFFMWHYYLSKRGRSAII